MRRLAVLFMALASACASRSVGHGPAAPPPPPPPESAPREAASGVAPSIRDPACAPVDEAKLEPPACADAIATTPIPPIVDPNETMGRLYERLVALARGTARGPVRIAVYGDSNHTQDFAEGHLRRVLQGRFGDAGHGWVPLARPHWIHHQDVKHDGTWSAWKSVAISADPILLDKNYGLGNMCAETATPGASLWVATADASAPIGTRASRFDVFYLRRPNGGAFDVVLDGAVAKRISTRADGYEAGIESIAAEDGPHKLEVVTRGQGMVRMFGVALERDVPGVVVDSLGTGAMNVHQMSWVSSATREPMAEKRAWDLVVIHLGTTMSQLWAHKAALKKVVGEMREALPNAAILLLTPPDFPKGRIGPDSEPRIVKVSSQIREVAEEEGVAFWDYRAAMGGDGSMATFVRKGLVTRDRIHLRQSGHDVMGDRMLRAMFLDLARWRGRHADAACGGAEDAAR